MKKPTPIISPEQADQIRKARVGAVLKKLRDGKSITAAEQRLIDENTATEQPEVKSGRPRKHSETLPVYDSIQACSSSTGIPESVLKSAKRKGCPAFRATRVYLQELIGWLFANDSSVKCGNWAEVLIESKAKREKLRFQKENGEVVRKSQVAESFQRIASRVTEARTQSETRDPLKLVGKDLHGMREGIRAIWDEVGKALSQSAKEFDDI